MAAAERDTTHKASECGPAGLRGSHAVKLAVTPRNFGRASFLKSAHSLVTLVTVSEPRRTRTRAAPDSPPLTTASEPRSPRQSSRAAGGGEPEGSPRQGCRF